MRRGRSVGIQRTRYCARANSNSISRKRRITDIVEHVADVLPGISALQSYTREEEDA